MTDYFVYGTMNLYDKTFKVNLPKYRFSPCDEYDVEFISCV